MRLVVGVAASLAAVALLASSAGASVGGWSKPQTIVPIGTAAYRPAMVTGPDGTTVVVWDVATAKKGQTGTFHLRYAVRTPAGKVQEGALGTMAGTFPQAALAVGGDGTVAVAWGAPSKGSASHVVVRIWRHGAHGFGPTIALSPGNASSDASSGDTPAVAVDGAGAVYVVWEATFTVHQKKLHKKVLQVVERQLAAHAKRWSSPLRLSSTAWDAHGARIAAAGNGNAAVSWQQSNSAVLARLLTPGKRGFGSPVKISASTFPTTPPTITESERGKVSVVWEQTLSKSRRIASKVAISGRFAARAQLVSQGGASQFAIAALAADGSGILAWEAASGGATIEASAMPASAKIWDHGIVKLSQPGYAVFGSPPTAAASDGLGVVAWSQAHNHALSVGVKVLLGHSWLDTRTFAGVGAPVVSAANNPSPGVRTLAAVVWPLTSGLQLSVWVR